MKFQKTLIVTLFFLPILLSGQVKISDDFKITTSAPYPVVNAQIKKYYSDGNGNIISIKKDDNIVTIQHFDDLNGKELSKKIYKDFPSKHEMQDIIQVGSKLFYIYSTEIKDDILETYTREIHFTEGTFDTPRLLFSSKGKVKKANVSGDITDQSMIPYINSSLSSDKSKILLRYTRFPLVRNNSKNKEIYGFYILDKSMQLIWGDEFTMPRTEAEMYNMSFCLTKDGVVQILSLITSSSTYELLNIGSSKSIVENKIELKSSSRFQDMTLKENTNGDLVWVGYYGNQYEKVNDRDHSGPINMISMLIYMKGIKTVLLNSKGSVLSVKDYEFPTNIINQYENVESRRENEKQGRGAGAGIPALTLRESVLYENGSILLVGEQFSQSFRTFVDRKDPNRNDPEKINRYDDIYISLINSTGSVEWIKKLPKHQLKFDGRGDNGIKFIPANDTSYIFYVEDEKNTALKEDDEPVLHSADGKGYFSVYKFDNNSGNVSKQFLFNMSDFQGEKLYQFDMSRVFGVRPNLFFLEAYMKGDEDKLVRMELLKK